MKEQLPKRPPAELSEIKRMRAERAVRLREQYIKETEEGLSKMVTPKELEVHEEAVKKQRLRKPPPQI